jgi:hypothetical protein
MGMEEAPDASRLTEGSRARKICWSHLEPPMSGGYTARDSGRADDVLS